MATRSALFIDRGDMPSLAALAIQPDVASLILWHPRETDDAAGMRLSVVRDHATTFSVRRLVICPPPAFGIKGLAAPGGLAVLDTLLKAAIAAGSLGCRRIIWPVCAGHDPKRITCEIDRADAIAALTEIEPTDCGAITFDLPVVDLSDMHLVDLIVDAGLPLDAFWPCGGPGPKPVPDSPSSDRWKQAFIAAGQTWPWPASSSKALAAG